ncbi:MULTISPECIES: AraC family transcriptional regulator [unclassified Chelatococcus]|uniref:AraC family transcriptional regulator n=1 Tax=unclassified Chelatococcus TaxID=2638111 RepID=UPI0020C1137F|nr:MULTISPECIES: AraC family transcriptional regulator [unclassified Chelatococcus]MCO5076373.1 AraC family transcriptional regulator [Chelatococcus sp.]CAH1671287.1 HTH araC/xylS-type domain-containing protein [Hyphomicrobiales bacterium]CAH1676516.1 HTH araC/xylS-type domain-containing protein [Hyphomicrobiales bacterium]
MRQNGASERFPIAAIPVIASYVLQGVPAFVRNEIGARTLIRANRAAGFDAELVEQSHCFITQRSVVDFINEIARAMGEPGLGLLLVPAMNVGTYGNFGRYILGAETLGQAIQRSISALPYHSSYDRLTASQCGDELKFSYTFALARAEGYDIIASTAAGELLSLFKAYLPDGWRPLRIELDIAAPHRTSHFEDVFQCPVIFNAPAVAIVVERHRMTAQARRLSRLDLTIEDVARERGGAPGVLLDVASEQIRTRLIGGNVSIDEIARSMDTSVRTLQRELNRAGTDFRSLTSLVRAQRATELLRERSVSITHISEDLGYSSPAGFSRAFRKATGFGPREFRKMERT